MQSRMPWGLALTFLVITTCAADEPPPRIFGLPQGRLVLPSQTPPAPTRSQQVRPAQPAWPNQPPPPGPVGVTPRPDPWLEGLGKFLQEAFPPQPSRVAPRPMRDQASGELTPTRRRTKRAARAQRPCCAGSRQSSIANAPRRRRFWASCKLASHPATTRRKPCCAGSKSSSSATGRVPMDRRPC